MEQNVDYTPYEGFETVGRCKAVFLRGEQAVADGKVVREHLGTYIPRHTCEYF